MDFGLPSNASVSIGFANTAPSITSLTLDQVSPISTDNLHLDFIYDDAR